MPSLLTSLNKPEKNNNDLDLCISQLNDIILDSAKISFLEKKVHVRPKKGEKTKGRQKFGLTRYATNYGKVLGDTAELFLLPLLIKKNYNCTLRENGGTNERAERLKKNQDGFSKKN